MVSIITINYNGLEETMRLLSSIKKHVKTPYEVMVVDNASEIDPRAIVARDFPGVKVIKSAENLGFAGGNNLGAKHANGDYLMFLNNDSLLEHDIIEPLKNMLSHDASIGIVSPMIRDANFPHNTQYAGYTDMHPVTGRNRLLVEPQSTEHPYQTAFAHGAAMMIRKSVFNRIGPMSEDYFLYYEEHDLVARVRKAGMRIMVDPTNTIRHEASASTGKVSGLKLYYHVRNRIMYMRRNSNLLRFGLFLVYFYGIAIPKQLFKLLRSGDRASIRVVRRACWWSTPSPLRFHPSTSTVSLSNRTAA